MRGKITVTQKEEPNWWTIGIIVLTLILVKAKALGHAQYSWWWAFSPILAFFGFILAVLVGCGLLLAAVMFWEYIVERNHRKRRARDLRR